MSVFLIFIFFVRVTDLFSPLLYRLRDFKSLSSPDGKPIGGVGPVSPIFGGLKRC